MGTITITVKDDIEERFRQTVDETKGKGKGVLGSAASEAMQEWVEKQRQRRIAKEMLALLEKGFEMGKFKKVSRDELHER